MAAKLLAIFDLNDLRQFRYGAIPRGGHFILGMLAYFLDLPHQALSNQSQFTTVPLIVVDDCALSGFRFSQFLEKVSDEQIIFAHLCSTPALREAILTTEPRVTYCLAACNLKDLTVSRFPDPEERYAWQKQWKDQAAGQRYWVGLAEHVIFPWNEPDRPVWNPETNQVEDNWRLASPDRNLKNWSKLGLRPRLGTKTAIRIPDQVAYKIQEGDVSLCNLDDETVYGLSGSSADIWRGLAAYGDLSATRDHMLELYDVDPDRLTADIQSLVDTLLAKGLLEPVNDNSAT